MILSICIPSYNRGKRALQLVNELLPMLDEFLNDLEVIVSNNGSTIGIEEYHVIRDINIKGLTYYEFDENQMYLGNFNQVIKLAKGDFCLIVSDEDHIDSDGIRYYIGLLKNNSDIGLVRAKTSMTYSNQENNIYLKQGKEAISDYFLIGSYISGIIYNRKIVTNELIDNLYNTYKIKTDNRAYFWYPHLFVDAYVMLNSDIIKCSKLLVIEGEDNCDQLRDESTRILAYGTYEDRLRQAKGFLEFLSNQKQNDGLMLKIVTMIIDKTYVLIYTQAQTYRKFGIEYDFILEKVEEELKNMIRVIPIPIVTTNIELVDEYIEAVRESYYREWNSVSG